MPSKSEVCRVILEKTGIVTSLQQDVEKFKSSKVTIQKGDTFKKWKTRVFEDSKIMLDVYLPCEIHPQALMLTIQNESDDFIKSIFREEIKDTEESAKKKMGKAIGNYPIHTIQDILNEHQGRFDGAVVEFLTRIVESSSDSTPVDELFIKLVDAYNDAAIQAKKK